MIIAVSDVHLGSAREMKKEFNKFLDYLGGKSGITDLVLCGDILDFWRRDLAGLALESADTIMKLQNLKEKSIKIHFIAGNHDYHLIKLKNDYEFCFYREEDLMSPPRSGGNRNCNNKLSLQSGGKSCRFLHGDQFDPLQIAGRFLFEPLSHTSDQSGDIASEVWDYLTGGGPGWFRSISKNKVTDLVNKLLKDPLDPLRNLRVSIFERTACGTVEDNEILIFGHSHNPFINTKRNVANCGSWLSYETQNNVPYTMTFVEIQNGEVKLIGFNQENPQESQNITEYVTRDCP